MLCGIFIFENFCFGDVISGTITDNDNNAPLAGVKIILNEDHFTFSEDDGSYILDTEGTGILRPTAYSDLFWEYNSGTLIWSYKFNPVNIEVRDLKGTLLDRYDSRGLSKASRYSFNRNNSGVVFLSLKSKGDIYLFRMTQIAGITQLLLINYSSAQNSKGPLAKIAAVNYLNFEKDEYLTVREDVNGSQSDLDIQMSKIDSNGQTRREARLTWFTSYPDPGSEECIAYNGCQWEGLFAGVNGKMTEEWVSANNIAAVHSKDFDTYRNKTLRLNQDEHQIDVVVYDMCSDNDCDGCCTRNAGSTGFLIDVETYTAERFGASGGTVSWICLDCN